MTEQEAWEASDIEGFGMTMIPRREVWRLAWAAELAKVRLAGARELCNALEAQMCACEKCDGTAVVMALDHAYKVLAAMAQELDAVESEVVGDE